MGLLKSASNRSVGIPRPAPSWCFFTQWTSQQGVTLPLSRRLFRKTPVNALPVMQLKWKNMNAKDKKVFEEMAKARCEAIQEARKKISQPLLAPDSFSTTRPCQEGTEHSSAKSSFHLWGPPQQVLGRGTYGQVYHVKNHVHFHLAAKMASEVRTTEELAKEAALLSKLCHPGIISQFGLTSTEKQVGLLLELGDLSLWKYLLEDKDLHLPTRWILVGQLADAMKYVHQHRVVHLDLKPANVILFGVRDFPTRVTAKIADFGLARQSPAVVRGDGVYSAPYRPLECLLAESREISVDGFADVYALGCMVYDLFAPAKFLLLFNHITFLQNMLKHQSNLASGQTKTFRKIRDDRLAEGVLHLPDVMTLVSQLAVERSCRSSIQTLLLEAQKHIALCT